ncbi:MAG: SMC-Scp complex subunit ScpB [Alphaproteobacteria bacterium]|jgi:segregation and condensation protein B|nr:SMC-Scp complex subunit ScpB [Alphaproteobacteria bacterium]
MSVERFELLRRLEALLFASAEPLSENILLSRLPEGTDLASLLEDLQGQYANRGVNLVQRGKGWAFRTAPDIAPFFTLEREVPRKLSRAAVETMAIIAYQQPVTRAEIEEIRGVALSKGTLDILLEAGWIKPKGRRRVPGRPITWGTADAFLDFFGLEGLDALPGIDELKAAGLLDRRAGVSTIAMREDDLFKGDRDEEGEDEDDVEDFLESSLDDDDSLDMAGDGR